MKEKWRPKLIKSGTLQKRKITFKTKQKIRDFLRKKNDTQNKIRGLGDRKITFK